MNDEKQIVENIKTAETAFPHLMKAGEIATIKNVAAAYRSLIKVPCTGCQYCMPCPNGVNIPANFSVYNDYCMFSDEQRSRFMYALTLMGGFTGKRSDASLCKDCKKCMERCPQHIEIPKLLKSVQNDLGGGKTEAIIEMRNSVFRQHPAKPT
jgi:predicted aldo/keto reductase-like oxidoreductase